MGHNLTNTARILIAIPRGGVEYWLFQHVQTKTSLIFLLGLSGGQINVTQK